MHAAGDTDKYKLKVNSDAKSEVWQQFPLVYEVCEGEEKEVKYCCACSKCFRVYQYRDSSGRHFGTRNLLEDTQQCVGGVGKPQLQQCVTRKVQLSKTEVSTLKRKAVEYCVKGYHSFRSVEQKGLINLMQTCVDYGAKYGKFEVASEMVKRKTLLLFSSSFFFFFPRLISAVADWMSTILLHMVWPSANLECRSEMCCALIAENTGRKKSPFWHHHTTLSGYIFATKERIELVKQQYLLYMSS